ncbi:MAG: ZIP family metal transporter [Eggerthellaceae bacterium]
MDNTALSTLVALLLPLAGTTLGSAFVFFLKKNMGELLQKALLGFAAGVMTAASVWSLIMPSIEMAEGQGVIGWVPAAVGFLGGMGLLLLIDHFLPHQHIDDPVPEGVRTTMKKPTMLIFAVALHNLPEGMAVGVVLAGFLTGETTITFAGVIALVIGIAIQNIPEGAIISMPLVSSGLSRKRAFVYGLLSGVVEPLGALLMIACVGAMTPLLPYVLSFAAGAMMYVVVEELIPETQTGRHTNIGAIAVAIGFTLMMILDVALG